ncbi:MAG: hypothetical protein EAZ36_03230 [Verrucomicrobia bacterium]|nr:MAG: hypothetical protein EAZ36_03230 [Verrucomicrobiota bacterium]
MSFFRKFERHLQALALPHAILALVVGQTFFYLSDLLGLIDVSRLVLQWSLVAEGEWWRLASFIWVPPDASPIFIAFALYVLYLLGTALEQEWGELRLNLFLITGWVLTIAAAWLVPQSVVTNAFIGGSIFLAFAYLNPNYVFYIFFILPVKVKWLALLTWLFFAYVIIFGGPAARILALASAGNFLIFFWARIWEDVRTGKRQMSGQLQRRAALREAAAAGARHRCVVCGKNSDSHPNEDFRYCSKCVGDQCYCEEHLRNHVHITEESKPALPPRR